jgi:hypothetical protein
VAITPDSHFASELGLKQKAFYSSMLLDRCSHVGSEIGALPLRTKRCPEGNDQRRRTGDQRKRETVIAAVLASEPSLERSVARRDEIAELVSESGEQRSRPRR